MKKTIIWVIALIAIAILALIMFNQDKDISDKTIVEYLIEQDNYSALVDAVVYAELVDALSAEDKLTVFAPDNDAFQMLLNSLGIDSIQQVPKEAVADILLYHVVGGKVKAADLTKEVETLNGKFYVSLGDEVYINGTSKVIATDICVKNGVIHNISKVLVKPDKNIVEIALSYDPDEFTALVAAVIKAELVDALIMEGPYTVFAPIDEAFVTLLNDLGVTLDDLTKEDLTPILTYHVVPALAFSTDLEDGQMIETLNGGMITITINENGVFVNDAQVVIPNVFATNGVIHVINKVLLP